MMIDKISEDALNKHANNPDVPNLSAAALKDFFDQPAEELRKKINEMIGEGGAPSLSTLAEQLTEKSDALMAQIEAQQHKEIFFENHECIGMAGELPDGVLLFGKYVQDDGDVYDSDIACQILIPAPEEPDGLTVEYGSVGFKRTDAEGNYALWILHKNQSAQISLIYRDPYTGYGIVRHLSSFTDTALTLSGVAADALATGVRLMGLDGRLEAMKEDVGSTKRYVDSLRELELENMRGVYVGEGEMPENCAVQIDPSGGPDTNIGHYVIDHLDLTIEEIRNVYDQCVVGGRPLVVKTGEAVNVCCHIYSNIALNSIAFLYMGLSSGKPCLSRHGYDMVTGSHTSSKYYLVKEE